MPSGLAALLILAAIHLFANQATILGWVWHGRFLSFAAGISFSYVFVDLLPALEEGQPVLKSTFDRLVPYLDRHAYLIALVGVLFYYGLHRGTSEASARNFWLSISGYLLFNLLMGASLADSNNRDIQPIWLFTLAMGMHYFVHDHNASRDNPIRYRQEVRWMLVAALLVGYGVGYFIQIPDAIVAMLVSFLAGAVLLNALRYELPKRELVGYASFVVGAILYTALLLCLGEP